MPGLQWGDYQDKQLDVLKSLEKSFEQSLTVSLNLSSSLQKISYSIDTIARKLSNNIEEYESGLRDINASSRQFSANIIRNNISLRSLISSLDSIRESSDEQRDTIEETTSGMSSMSAALNTLISGLGKVAYKMNSFSDISNKFIQNTGETAASIQRFRGSLIDEVSSLNKETGSLFNPLKSYELMVNTLQGVTGDLEAATEMSRPLLLASETMNLNLSSVADLFNKFYNRYRMNSSDMQEVLDSIRENTAGNSASEEEALKNMTALEHLINFKAGGNNELRTELLSNVAAYTSWIGSMGATGLVDPASLLLKVAGGNWSANSGLLSIFQSGGLKASGQELSNMALDPQGSRQLIDAYLKGVANIASQDLADGNMTSFDQLMQNYGLDQNTALGIYNLLNDGYVTFEDFMRDQSASQGMISQAEDKYVSFQDKVENWLDGIYGKLASIQEDLGFGLTDILLITNLLKDGSILKGLGKVATKAGPAIASLFSGAAGTGAAGGALATIGSVALPVTAIAAVLTVAGFGIKNALELTGNAKEVVASFEDINDATHEEYLNRLETAGNLQSATDKQQAILDAGLLTQSELDELSKKNGNSIQSFIDAYSEAAKSMESITNSVMKKLEDELKDQQDVQQDSFLDAVEEQIKSSKSGLLSPEMTAMMDSIMMGVTDQDVIDKYNKFKEDGGGLTKSEALRIINGNWFTHTNLRDQTIDVGSMSSTDALFGLTENDYVNFDQATVKSSATMFNDLRTLAEAATRDPQNIGLYKTKAEKLIASYKANDPEAYKLMRSSGAYEDLLTVIAQTLGLESYAVGSNYIAHDQLAVLHEGEAVIPKKYNPAASQELSQIREQQANSQQETRLMAIESKEYLASINTVLVDIKEFLSVWKDDNARESRLTEVRNKFNTNNSALASYYSGM